MPHVHNVSSDEDELEDEDWGYEDDPERRPIPWIPIASAGVAVVLVVILVILLVGGGGGGKKSETVTTTASTAAPLPALAPNDPRVVAAQAALDAWGVFEGTGKLEDLGNTMDPKGPQYLALKKEAEAKKTTGAYTAVIANPRLVPATDAQTAVGEQVIRADVVWKRTGTPDRAVTWDLALRSRPDPAGLWLWTARAISDSPSTGPTDFCGAARNAAAVPTQSDFDARIANAKTDADKVAIAKDIINQRAASDAQLAASAPAEIKTQAQAVATGWAVYQQLASSAQKFDDLAKAYEKASKDKQYLAGEQARPAVNEYAQRTCGVDIDPSR